VSPDTAQSLDIFFSGCHHEAGTRHSLDHIDEFALQPEQVRGSDQLWSRKSSCEACEGVVMGSLHGSDHKALELFTLRLLLEAACMSLCGNWQPFDTAKGAA
jgi:hypothetical protein